MYEYIFAAAAAANIFVLGFVVGAAFSARRHLLLKVTKKEDYEEKIEELDRMIEDWKKETNTEEGLGEKIKSFELFPEDLNRDFGLPRELK